MSEAWNGLHKAEWSWWLSKKADFLIKKDSTCQCVLKWHAKEHQGTMQPSAWPEVEKPQNTSSKKAGCFSNVTQLEKYLLYDIQKNIQKNNKLWKATRVLTIDIQYYIQRPYPFLCQPTNSHSVLVVWYGLLHHQLQQNLCNPRHSCIDCHGHQSEVNDKDGTGKATAAALETLLCRTVNW